jgi:hypothetical protein
MGLQIRLALERLVPFGPFHSLNQVAFWIATWGGGIACLSLFIHDRHLLAVQAVGAAIGGVWGGWFGLLPYELKIEPTDLRECLAKVSVYLARSNMRPTRAGEPCHPGVGEWLPNRRILWKGMEVEVSVKAGAIFVRGPRSMIRPLWRNFNGVWHNLLAPA